MFLNETKGQMMNILMAEPRGFCAGVDRAIQIVEKALEKFGAPIYVRHEIVHNKYVVDELKEKGVIFIEDIEKVPEHSILIYSAHGVSEEVIKDIPDREYFSGFAEIIKCGLIKNKKIIKYLKDDKYLYTIMPRLKINRNL